MTLNFKQLLIIDQAKLHKEISSTSHSGGTWIVLADRFEQTSNWKLH